MRSSPRSRRWRRWLTGLSVCVAGLYGLYVVGTWLALRFNVLEGITADWNDVHIQAPRGYSLWPGIFHLEDARLRFKDHNVEMEVAAGALRLDLGLWAVWSRTLHVKKLSAQAARFRMVHRVSDGHANRKRLAAFPDIGFERSLVYDAPSPPYRPLPFRILVEDVDARVEEAWILEYRAVGHMRARGGFELHENVHVFPSSVQVETVEVHVEQRRFASAKDCEIHAELGPFDRKTATITDVLSVTDAGVRCNALVSDLSVADVYFPDAPVTLAGSGRWQSNLALSRGQLIESKASFEGKITPLSLANHPLNGQVSISLSVDPQGELEVEGDWNEAASGLPTAWRKARVEASVEQERLWQGTLRDLKFEASGVSWDDPELVRKLHPDAKLPLTKLHEGAMGLRYSASDSRLNLQAEGTLATFPKQGEIVSCVLSLTATCQEPAAGFMCSKLAARCQPAVYSHSEGAPVELEGQILVNDLSLEDDELEATLLIKTSDPKDLLRAAANPTAVTTVGISLLPLGDLNAIVRLRKRKGTIVGSVTDLSTGVLRGEGHFVFAHALQSAWLLKTPVGRFGVQQSPQETKVTAFVGSDWLEDYLANH